MVRASNRERQKADWAAYRGRWERLGEPARDWLEKEHHDPRGTPRRYWGRVLTSGAYRRTMLIARRRRKLRRNAIKRLRALLRSALRRLRATSR